MPSPIPLVTGEDSQVGAYVEQAKQQFEQFLQDDAPVIVRKIVEDYCQNHFTPLAREVITTELRRLAEERTRLLVER